MSLNEFIVEEAALCWFGELGHAFGHSLVMASVSLVVKTILGL